MPRRNYSDVETRCVICTAVVPEIRVRNGAITCSKECTKTRENALRAKKDNTECRYCRHPSTPEERAAFARFRKLEAKQPHLLYPAEYEAWRVDLSEKVGAGLPTPELFAKEHAMRRAQRESA